MSEFIVEAIIAILIVGIALFLALMLHKYSVLEYTKDAVSSNAQTSSYCRKLIGTTFNLKLSEENGKLEWLTIIGCSGDFYKVKTECGFEGWMTRSIVEELLEPLQN